MVRPICIRHMRSSNGRCAGDTIRTFVAILAGLLATAPAAHTQETGPKEVLITYRCEPVDRPAFRAFLQSTEVPVLKKLRTEGTLKSYQVLFNPVVTRTFDAMIVMDFSSYASTARWIEIERRSPGGLNPKGLKLGHPLQTYFADRQWYGSSDNPGPAHLRVYYVIPYSYSSLDQYKSYISGYLIPQVSGWIEEGVLSRYSIYLNRYPVGDPWDSLFIYEYRDLQSFGKREEAIAKVRDRLRSDVTWKHWSDIKANVRTESENTVMELLPLKPTRAVR